MKWSLFVDINIKNNIIQYSMELSRFYLVFILFLLLSTVDLTEFNFQCPISRRLLSVSSLKSSLIEKKSHDSSTSSKSSSLPSSPPKYARSSDSHGLTVYIRPLSPKSLGPKTHSYSHLLKSKLHTNKGKRKSHTNKEKTKLKRSNKQKKKELKKKNSTKHKSSINTKIQELVGSNHDELHQHQTLFHTDSTPKIDKKIKKSKKSKSNKQVKVSEIKNVTRNIPIAKDITKKLPTTTTTTALPINNKKVKNTKRVNEANIDEKKKPKEILVNKISENIPLTSSMNDKPSTTSSPSPLSSSKIDRKPQKDKSETINTIDETLDTSDDENNSVVGRAYHFVKNMFQLSDDFLNDNHTQNNHIVDIINEHQQYHSRKLLSINDDNTSIIVNNDITNNEYDFDLNDEIPDVAINNLSFIMTSISKRRLLSVKTKKHSISSKDQNDKEKRSESLNEINANDKPKVGWAYRYRISRYLDAQKLKQNKNKKKITGEKKTKQHFQKRQSNSKQNQKKIDSSHNKKLSKRKLLKHNNDDDTSGNEDKISNQDTVNTVSITETFVPKRRLLMSKRKIKHEEDNKDDEEDIDKTQKFRRMKSFDESTDPILIVQSYDHGLYKPRVGWQFRYRVSRYIDSLRDNIREDQERLKLGLQAIKRKTPQELSGRRKRVSDKPVVPNADEIKKKEEPKTIVQDDKPNVGWRYRYRINKMTEAKKRGDYIDNEQEKRKEHLEQEKKQSSLNKSPDDEHIQGENDLDPELRQVNAIGRRVGWAYRYRIRRKLDDLKRQQAETGMIFDLPTLSFNKTEETIVESKPKSKEKKKTKKPTEDKPKTPTGDKPKNKTKSVGSQDRSHVSKMHEAQKHNKSKTAINKSQDQTSTQKELDPELARLTSEDRSVGWKYRYRVQRKLDALNEAANREDEKRTKKLPSSSSKGKKKKNLMEKVEDSSEKSLNIDETSFTQYLYHASSYVLNGLLPTTKKSICILPLPMTFSFCRQDNNEQSVTETEKTKQIPTKKLKIRKEKRAKQFIRSHVTKLGKDDKYTERRVDEAMKNLYKTPSLPPSQTQSSTRKHRKTQKNQYKHASRRPNQDEQKKHFKEEHMTTKKIGVESKKNNKKRSQLIGQEVKIKHKLCPFAVTTPPPAKQISQPSSSSSQRPRTISEVIRDEAATLFGGKSKSSKTPEEIKDEINEANEIIREHSKIETTKTSLPPPSDPIDSTISSKEDQSTLNNNNKATSEENTKENLHDMLNLEDRNDSS
ncbi:unnamed protein product [Rotaria sordida]|uniref:Uncharacterized protein n=1 Tax=Rotaria sordida TaxID=392033 RepID=A0A813THN7_9BILA|nr:unnamed protein product [Rotaria sordida]CAF0814011.1 unnamed protein product [Rotaria sordida]